MNNNEKEAVQLLSEIVEWWENWNSSSEPTEMEDPPIEEAKALLLKFQD